MYLTIDELNDLKVLVYNIHYAYLTAKCQEIIWTVVGTEFDCKQEEDMFFVTALYGLKLSGADFRAFLSEQLYEFFCRKSIADPDVWMIPEVRVSY